MSPTMAETCRSRCIDRRPRAHERVRARARDPRLHVVADLPRLRAALADVVGEGAGRRCAHGVGAREVRGVVAPEPSRGRAPARCSWSASSAARRRRGCSRGWRRPRAAARGRRSGGARAPARRAGGWSRSRGRGPSPTSGRPACRGCCRAAAPPGTRRSARTSRSPSARGGGVPSRSQRAITGALPSRSARRSTSWARPSISRKTTPGTSEAIAPARRAWRRTTLRCHVSSSSIASSAEAVVVMIANPSGHHDAREPAVDAGAGADRGRDGHEPAVEHDGGASQRDHAERKRQAAERRPHERVEHRGDDRGTSAPAGPWTLKSDSSAPSSEQGRPVQGEDDQAADGESPEPGHDASVAPVRVIQPHPMRVTTPHPSGA